MTKLCTLTVEFEINNLKLAMITFLNQSIVFKNMVNKILISSLLFVLGINMSSAQNTYSLPKFEEDIKNLSVSEQIDTLIRMSYRTDLLTLPNSILFARSALDISKENKYKVKEAHSYDALGNAQIKSSLFEEALNSFNEGLKIFKMLGHQEGIMLCHKGLSLHYTKTGNYEQATKSNLKALEIAETLNLPVDIADIHNNIGVSLNYQGKHEQAITYLEPALTLSYSENFKQKLLDNLGIAYKNTGQIEKALDCYKQSIQICEDLKDNLCDVYALNNMSVIYEQKIRS